MLSFANLSSSAVITATGGTIVADSINLSSKTLSASNTQLNTGKKFLYRNFYTKNKQWQFLNFWKVNKKEVFSKTGFNKRGLKFS